MSSAFLICVVFCAIGCAVHLAGEHRHRAPISLAGKVIGSSAFVVAAWFAGAMESGYGRFVLVGLALSWCGDLLLVARDNRRLFLLALVAFLLGHVAYGAAFSLRGLAGAWLVGGTVVMAGFALALRRWLSPHVDGPLWLPVQAYVGVISAMMALAIGSFGASANGPLILGAALFVISDLGVARQRFVAPGFVNRAWSVPVYFFAQVLLAASVAFE